MAEFVIGVIFLLYPTGELAQAPALVPFETMSECQAAREELKQYAADASGDILIVEMACVPPEAFQ